MKNKTKYVILDRTLKHLSEKASDQIPTTSALSKEFKTDYHVMHKAVQQLADKGYIHKDDVTDPDPQYHGDVSLTLTPDGRYFFSVEGGFDNLYKKERLDHTWKIVSIVASIVNAIALLVLSILAIND